MVVVAVAAEVVIEVKVDNDGHKSNNLRKIMGCIIRKMDHLLIQES